jgi:hypothetical protein
VYRVELHDFEPDGIEVHWFVNDDYAQACRFSDRELAIRWAKEKRGAILWDVFDWP